MSLSLGPYRRLAVYVKPHVPLLTLGGLLALVVSGTEGLAAWLVLRFDSSTAYARYVVREVDRQPIRQTVELIRSQSPDAMTATFGISDRQAAIYDPRVRILESAADLDRVIGLNVLRLLGADSLLP